MPPNATARAYIPATSGQKVMEGGKAIEKAVGVGIVGHGHPHHDPAHEGLIVELASGAYEFEVK